MSDADSEVIETLLDEFAARLRRGESPSVEEYATAHPGHATEIRELFPAVEAMERMAQRRQQPRGAAVVDAPDQLGDFRLLRQVGRGGMGVVYEAEQISLARRVAVKILPRSALLGPASLQRFEREARTAANLHHTNIVPVFGVGEDQGYHYLVMQLIPGVGLDRIIAQLTRDYGDKTDGGSPSTAHFATSTHDLASTASVAHALVHGEYSSSRPGPGSSLRLASADSTVTDRHPPLPAATTAPAVRTQPVLAPPVAIGQSVASEEAADHGGLGTRYWRSVAHLGAQAADALHYAHQRGTLHRDIKPGNLLLDDQGIVWITDFGLAKAIDRDEVTQTGEIVGTLRYMAPERFRGDADARGDIYSLGVTLYELLTLRPPFENASPSVLMQQITTEPPTRPRALNPAIPRDLETIVLKAMARESAARYASAGALAEDLGRFLEDRPILARRQSAVERLVRWARRNRAVAGLGTLAVLLLVLVALVASIGYVQTRRANRQAEKALIAESHERAKAEALSALTLEALDDIFEQYVPSRIVGTAEVSLDGSDDGTVRVPAQAPLSKGSAVLLERMLDFYKRLAEQNASDAQLRRKVADANRRVGDIHRRLGNFDQAEAAYRAAIEGYRRAAAGAGAAAEIARIQNELGDLRWSARGEGDGRVYHTAAMETLQAASAAEQATAHWRFERARTHYLLGRRGPPQAIPGRGPQGDENRPGRERRFAADVDRTGSDDVTHLRQAISLLEKLREEQPLLADYRHLLACCWRELPLARREPGAAPSLETVDQAIALLEGLVADYPEVAEYRWDLSKAYAKGDWNASPPSGVAPEQEPRLRQSLRISERLVAENPNVPEYAATHVQNLYALTEVLRRTRRGAEAETTLRAALAAQSSVVDQSPRTNSFIVWKAILQESLAKLLAERGRTDEARSLLNSAIAALEPLLQAEPQAARVRNMLGRCYRNLADMLSRAGDTAAANEYLRRGRDLRPDR